MICQYCKEPAQFECVKCKKFFCNNKTNDISHLIFHLVKSKHIAVHFNGHSIECKQCNDTNIFRLSVHPEFNGISHDLYCHECILPIDSPNAPTEFHPLIVSRTVSIAPTTDSKIHRKEMERLEESSLPHIKLRSDAHTYVATLTALINAERDKEKEVKEGMRQENITLRFENEYCYFHCQNPVSGFCMKFGDEVRFTHKTGITFTGVVCEDQFNGELKVHNESNDTQVEYPRTGYTVEYIWNEICYRRMCWALRMLYKDRKRNVILPYVLTGRPHRKLIEESNADVDYQVLTPPGFFPLNDAQRAAVKAALTRQLTLIQGPPGTGKTTVSAVTVYNLVKHFRKKVLVVAPSNTAVDQLAIQINNTGLKVLRVMSLRRESKSNEADFLCLHNLLREFDEPEVAKHVLLRAADVVCCTCITAGQQLFNDYSFPFVLIDEAVQSTEPLSLIPCAYGAVKLIMVGDHKQLGPTILNEEVAQCGLKRSLFERLLQIGVEPYLLNTQYRMHPDLCKFPSEYFYDGQLQTGSQITKRLDFPNNFFYACHGKEEISQSGTSFFNKVEALIVESIIRFLFKQGVREHQIGVITPYEGQRSYILGNIFGNEPGNLEIANVDAFQGREKDFIIVSLVRSNSFQGIGFVADKRRMNVALTRAKYGLAIVGNPFTFCKHGMWSKLLKWYDERESIYEGPIGALRKTNLQAFDMKALAEAII